MTFSFLRYLAFTPHGNLPPPLLHTFNISILINFHAYNLIKIMNFFLDDLFEFLTTTDFSCTPVISKSISPRQAENSSFNQNLALEDLFIHAVTQ